MQQQKAVSQQKQSAPAGPKKGTQQTEYASVLRDTEADTGGTVTAVEIEYTPSTDTQQSAELPLHLDLIGKVAGNTVTLQDTTGKQIDVDAPDHNLQEGNYNQNHQLNWWSAPTL